MKNYETKFILLLILMTVLFGISFIASKNALQGLGIFQLVFGRNFYALVLLTLIFANQRSKFKINRKDRKQFLLLSFLSPVGYFFFETLGLYYTSPANVSLIIATIPIFTTIFAAWILKERSQHLAILGIFTSLLGVYFVVSTQQPGVLAPRPVLGNMLTFGAAISGGMYAIISKRLSGYYSPTTITYYQTVVASIVFFPLAFIESYNRQSFNVDLHIFFNVSYLAVGCSVLGYFILNYTLKHLKAIQVTIFTNLIPVVTIMASWFIYRDLLQLLQFVGASLILGGIYLNFSQKDRYESIVKTIKKS